MSSTQTVQPNPWQAVFDRQVGIRALSALVFAVVAVSGAIAGGWWAAIVAAVVVTVIHQEWTWLTEETRQPTVYFTAGLVLALAYVWAGAAFPDTGLGATGVVLVVIAVATAAVSSGSFFRPLGVAYAGIFGLAALFIRYSPDDGMAATIVLFVTVWGTDVAAFFSGRLIGGPRLWPIVSPNKTWAGAVGGAIGGVVCGGIAAALFGIAVSLGLVLVLAVLAIAAVGGDLFESWVKRQVGEKDSGWLVPGHGGLLDRVDGLVFAAAAALVIGWLHGGSGDVAQGLVQW